MYFLAVIWDGTPPFKKLHVFTQPQTLYEVISSIIEKLNLFFPIFIKNEGFYLCTFIHFSKINGLKSFELPTVKEFLCSEVCVRHRWPPGILMVIGKHYAKFGKCLQLVVTLIRGNR